MSNRSPKAFEYLNFSTPESVPDVEPTHGFEFSKIPKAGFDTEDTNYRFWLKKGPFWRRVGRFIPYEDKQKGKVFATRTVEGEPLLNGVNEGEIDVEDRGVSVLEEGDRSKTFKAIGQYSRELADIEQQIARGLPTRVRQEKEDLGNQVARELHFLIDEVYLDKDKSYLRSLIDSVGSWSARQKQIVDEMLSDAESRLTRELKFSDAEVGGVLENEFLYSKDMDLSIADPAERSALEDRLLEDRLRRERGEWSNAEKKYANALLAACHVYGKKAVEDVADECKSAFDHILVNELGLEPNVFSTSMAWANWDLAKQYYFFLHPEENDPNYSIGNPFDPSDTAKREEVVVRHLGWDVAFNSSSRSVWGTEPEATEIADILSNPDPIDGHIPSHKLARIGHLLLDIVNRGGPTP